MHPNVDILKILNELRAALNDLDVNERSPLSISVSMRQLEAVKFLVEAGALPEVASNDVNVLHLAVRAGCKEGVEYMLGKFPELLATAKNRVGKAPFPAAVALNQNDDSVKLFSD